MAKKGKTNRMAKHWAGRVNAATIQYHERINSLAIGELVPETRQLEFLHRTGRAVKPGKVMPETGYQVLEERDPVYPRCRSIDKYLKETEKSVMTISEVFVKSWQTDRYQGLSIFHYQKFVHKKYGELRLYFSGREFFWMRIRDGLLELSPIYPRDVAMWRFKATNIPFIVHNSPG